MAATSSFAGSMRVTVPATLFDTPDRVLGGGHAERASAGRHAGDDLVRGEVDAVDRAGVPALATHVGGESRNRGGRPRPRWRRPSARRWPLPAVVVVVVPPPRRPGQEQGGEALGAAIRRRPRQRPANTVFDDDDVDETTGAAASTSPTVRSAGNRAARGGHLSAAPGQWA